MAIKISQYVQPGVFLTEEIVQPIPGFQGLPREICLVGEGETCKTVVNENHIRAYVTSEIETVTPVGNNGTFSPTFQTDGAKTTMALAKNGDVLVDDSFTVSTVSGVSTVTILAAFFDSTAEYEFSYQSLTSDNSRDVLVETVSGACASIVQIGSFPGTKNFVSGSDYELDTTKNAVHWLTPAAASITGSAAQTFSGLVGKTLIATFDGAATKTATFLAGDFSNVGAATASEVVTRVNTDFGATYGSNATNHLKLTSLTTGENSAVQMGAGTANTILGFTAGTLNRGAGKNPAAGEEYFVTYKAVRPDSEYNHPILSTNFDQFISRVGAISSTNALALAGQIVFEQNPPFVFHIQVKNTGTGKAAQDIDYRDALKGAELNADITDVVVLGHPTLTAGGTKPLVRSFLRDHIVKMSSLTERGERIGWFGLPINAAVGDAETGGSFIYVATQESQVSADSVGRGRFVLTAPDYLLKTYRLPNGVVKQLKLDGTYLAAASAAKEASFLSPSEGLLRKTLAGLDDVHALAKTDRDLLASRGCNVIINKAGSILFFDPVTTDLSSAEFREINVMAQKDNIVRRVRTSADDTLIGIVPDDLAQFRFEVKSVVATTLKAAIADGAIAPFQNDDGTLRDINLQTDIIVTQRFSDPTTYDFKFFFFVKFVAKRLLGTFSIIVPTGA